MSGPGQYSDRAAWAASDHPKAVRRRHLMAARDHLCGPHAVAGPGAHLHDCLLDGSHDVWVEDIPALSSGRLQRRVDFLHEMTHTADGLHGFLEARRKLLELSIELRCCVHELHRRGQLHTTCKHCTGGIA